MKINYLVTVKDELKEVKNLLNQLFNFKEDEDEIVVLQDTTIDDDKWEESQHQVNSYLYNLNKEQKIKMTTSILNNDFASFKNFGKSECTGDYIFQIDADEIVSTHLLKNIKTILSMNEDVELYWLPRLNIVNGLTDEWVKKWGWRLSDIGEYKNLVNWPDYQSRLFKNIKKIQWVGRVHEVLTGAQIATHFPSMLEYALHHEKQLDRQIRQNEHYSKIIKAG